MQTTQWGPSHAFTTWTKSQTSEASLEFKPIYMKCWWVDANTVLAPVWHSQQNNFFKKISSTRPLLRDLLLTLLSVVLSTSSRAQLLWRRSDEQKTRVTFGLFVVFHVSPLSLSNCWASVVRVRGLMLWPGRLIPEPSSRAVLVAWRAVATPPASRVAASVSPSVCSADTRHVCPLGHHLQTSECIVAIC